MRLTAGRRRAWLALALGAVLGLGGAASGANRANWTVLAYLSGDGSLEPAALEYLRRLAATPATDRVSVAAQIDRGPGFSDELGDFADARRVIFEGGEPGAARRWRWTGWRGEVNMGDPRTLAEFVAWGGRALPADHYLLLLMGHGSGVRPLLAGAENREYGVAYDATSAGDSLTPKETAEWGPKVVEALGGRKISVLAVDACFSASMEMVGELADYAEVMTGSPDLLYEPGVPWDEVLRSVCDSPAMPAEEVAKCAVEGVRTSQEAAGTRRGSYAAARLAAAADLEAGLAPLCDELRGSMGEVVPVVTAARAHAGRGGLSGEMVDLAGFLGALARAADEAALPQVSRLASEALGKLNAMVVASYSGEGGEPADGPWTWSAFFPGNVTAFPADYLETSRFARDSGWGPFLESYLGHLETLLSPTAADGPEGHTGNEMGRRQPGRIAHSAPATGPADGGPGRHREGERA